MPTKMQLPPFKLERYFAKHEFTARHMLCASDCESVSLKTLLDFEPSSRAEFEKLWLGYTESFGHPTLRKEIARLYTSLNADNLFTHTGAQEAIFVFANSVLAPNDHAIVHWPCYQSLFQLAETIGCSVTKWEADPLRDWALDIDFLKKSVRPNTKVVILNCPHNPTGYVMKETDLRELAEWLDKRGIILFMDEVYKGLEYEGTTALPSACDLSETAVSLGVLSKAYGLAGLRMGWIATRNRAVLKQMEDFKDYTTICNSAPSEFLSTLALRHRDTLLDRNRQIIKANLSLLDSFFDRFTESFEWVRPKAGCIAFPRLKKEQNADRFCEMLLEKTGILLAPGSKFGYGNGHFRIGYGRKNFPEVLEILANNLF